MGSPFFQSREPAFSRSRQELIRIADKPSLYGFEYIGLANTGSVYELQRPRILHQTKNFGYQLPLPLGVLTLILLVCRMYFPAPKPLGNSS